MVFVLRRAVVTGLACVLISLCGCATYWSNRGNDAMDIFDVGVTVSAEPGFAVYAGLMNVLSLGYAHVDGTLLGIGDSNAGALPSRVDAVGLLLWGEERIAYGWQPEPAVAGGAEPGGPERATVGVIGLIQGPGQREDRIIFCPKIVHLGWVGLTLNCKLNQLVDFVLGWTTLDIQGDDK